MSIWTDEEIGAVFDAWKATKLGATAHTEIRAVLELVAVPRRLWEVEQSLMDRVCETLIRADSVMSLVGYRYTRSLPDDVAEDLRATAYVARELEQALRMASL